MADRGSRSDPGTAGRVPSAGPVRAGCLSSDGWRGAFGSTPCRRVQGYEWSGESFTRFVARRGSEYRVVAERHAGSA